MLSQSPRLDSDNAIHSRRNGLIDNTPRESAAAPVLVILSAYRRDPAKEDHERELSLERDSRARKGPRTANDTPPPRSGLESRGGTSERPAPDPVSAPDFRA